MKSAFIKHKPEQNYRLDRIEVTVLLWVMQLMYVGQHFTTKTMHNEVNHINEQLNLLIAQSLSKEDVKFVGNVPLKF